MRSRISLLMSLVALSAVGGWATDLPVAISRKSYPLDQGKSQ